MKLTKEEIEQFPNTTIGGRVIGKTLAMRVVNELLEYKSIEEELGIDLITLFKALTKGVWFKDNFETNIHQYYPTKVYLHYDKGTFWLREGEEKPCPHHIRTKDYKKTWALTKEELA